MANWSACRHEVEGKSGHIYISLDNVLTVQQNEGTVTTILMVGNVEVHVDDTPDQVGVYD